MPFFFPEHAQRPFYRTLYDRLTAVERGMVLREFIGVTYRRRFQFFKQHHFHHPLSAFKHNLQLAAKRQDRRFCIRRRIWRKTQQRQAYLELIFRHYVLGFVAQLLRKHHGRELRSENGCYPDAPLMLAALEWFAEHEAAVTSLIHHEIEQVVAENSRHLYLYCLRAFWLTRQLCDRAQLAAAVGRSQRYYAGGQVPLGRNSNSAILAIALHLNTPLVVMLKISPFVTLSIFIISFSKISVGVSVVTLIIMFDYAVIYRCHGLVDFLNIIWCGSIIRAAILCR